jgi:putative peptidoglycan lipid II flippase
LCILIFYLPFICLAAVLQAALNSVKHFAVPAFTPVLLNLIWIAVLAVIITVFPDMSGVNKAFLLAFGVIGGGILQFIIQVPVLRKHGLKLRIVRRFNLPEVTTVFKSMVPVVLALAVMQINVLVDRLLAKWMIEGEGAISALFYGNRLIQFPLAIFGIAVSVAVFPSLREFAVDRDYSRIWKTLNLGIRMLIFIIIPCSVGLIVIGRPVIDLFFNWGQFAAAPHAASRVYLVVAAYSLGLLFFCFNIVITRVFHSLDNRVFPARVAGLMVFLNIGLNILFLTVTPLKEAGLALSTSITALVNVIILLARLVKGYGYDEIRGIIPAFFKASAAACIMGAGVVLTAGMNTWSLISWGEGLSGKLLRTGSGIGIGIVLYFGCHLLFRTAELRQLKNTFLPSKAGKGKEDPV